MSRLGGALLLAAVLVSSCAEEPVEPAAPAGIDLNRLNARPPRPPLPLRESPPTAEEKIAFYLKTLEAGHEDEVRWASGELGAAGEAAIGPLAKLLAESVRKNTLLAENILGVFAEHLSAPGAIESMTLAAGSDDGRVRHEAARALSRTGVIEAVAPLLDLACDRQDPVAARAIEGLAALEFEEVGRGLLGRFADRLNPRVRILSVPLIAERLPDEDARSFLKGNLGAKEIELRLIAARELYRLGDPCGLPVVRALLETPTDPGLAHAAREVLAEARDEALMDELASLAKGSSKEEVIGAVGLLGYYDSEKARGLLWELARAEDADVRQEAFYSLLRSGDQDAKVKVVALLDSPVARDRMLAALVLGALRAGDTEKALAEALQREPDRNVRLKLASALALIGRESATTAIVETFHRETETDPSLAATAYNIAETLNSFDELPEEAHRALVKVAGSKSEALRMNAARVLGPLGRGDEDRVALAALLTDPSVHVRRAAILAWLSFADAEPKALRKAYESETDPDLEEAMRTVAEQLAYRWR